MILDTSAILAVLRSEEDALVFANAIRNADCCRIAAPTFVELSRVLEATAGDTGV